MHEQFHNAVKERVAPARHGRAGAALPSAHLLDLGAVHAPQKASFKPEKRAPHGLSYLKHLLDQRLHLADVRHRRLSTHHLDWKDFPPKSAKTLPHAIAITVRRFFTEHPLADLTILTVFHLAGMIAFKTVIRPIELLFSSARATANAKAVADAAHIRVMPAEHKQVVRHVAPVQKKPRAERKPFAMPSFAFALPAGWRRNMLGFAVAAMLVVLPVGAYDRIGSLRVDRASAMENGNAAIAMLKAAETAAKAFDFAAVGQALTEASQDFGAARLALGSVGTIMNVAADALPINTTVTSAGPLLLAGEEASLGGAKLAAGLAGIDAAKTPLEKLRLARATIDDALPHIESASRAIGKVSVGIAPENYRDDIELAKRELPKLAATLRSASDAAATLEGLIGANGTRRYLVLFQNNSELRPTGGFIGSFALLDVHDGTVEKMEIPGGGSYDLQGSLGLHLNAPQPLRLINPRWEFQDANWYPDFPTSAALLTRFYEKSGGPTIDGVIAIDATFMEKLLGVSGPIDMPEYGKTITQQNFFYETQKQVELDYDKKENKPKQFIADLAPKMIERLTSADRSTLMALAVLAKQGLSEKDLQVWTRDADAQARLASFGWDGAIRTVAGDYLAVVHTNIAGQKTDLAMQEKIEHSAKVLPDGETIVTLTLTRTHTGQKGALFSGARNVDYLRVYVPKGSELVEARGFAPPDPKLFSLTDAANTDDAALAAQEQGSRTDRPSGTMIFEEQGHTVFGNWVQTDPGDTAIVTLVYRLPPGTTTIVDRASTGVQGMYDRLIDSPARQLHYSLTVQKQAGARPSEFVSLVDLPRAFVPSSALPERTPDDRGRLIATQELRSDTSFDVTAESQ